MFLAGQIMHQTKPCIQWELEKVPYYHSPAYMLLYEDINHTPHDLISSFWPTIYF